MSRSIERKTAVDAAETDAWIENEVMGCEFPDGYLALTHDPPPGNTVIWRAFVD